MTASTGAPSTRHYSSRDSDGWGSNDSYDTYCTNLTANHANAARPPEPKTSLSSSIGDSYVRLEPHRPATGNRACTSPSAPPDPRASVDTYASTTTSEDDLEDLPGGRDCDTTGSSTGSEPDSIPALPVYRREVIEPNVRPSTPSEFARLFPSLNRFSIQHDEFTPDGNMNLRIDTIVTGRRRTAIQLFHLRMYDLAKRDFSLRRYSRDSGREVCNSKRKYSEPAAPKPPKKPEDGRPTLQRSVTSAIKTLSGTGGKPGAHSGSSVFGLRSPGSKRPGTSHSLASNDGEGPSFVPPDSLSDGRSPSRTKPQRPQPTNTIKLEFSNYARVDVHRRGSSKNKRYEFEWWGHRYAWRRSVDKQLGIEAFHLVRDGNANAPVAHIVPETRSHSQVLADELAGGWVPPCHMWFADESVIDAMTDVADVIMASGLVALVDNCIKERWQTEKVVRIPVPLTSRTLDVAPKSLMQHVFGRRNSNEHSHHPSSPSSPRFVRAISAY